MAVYSVTAVLVCVHEEGEGRGEMTAIFIIMGPIKTRWEGGFNIGVKGCKGGGVGWRGHTQGEGGKFFMKNKVLISALQIHFCSSFNIYFLLLKCLLALLCCYEYKE